MIIPPIALNAPPARATPSPNGRFATALATAKSRQALPGVGTIFRAIAAEKPLAIAEAAGKGFLLGGPIGAAVSGGLTALAPFFHLPLPPGDGVTGDQSVTQRTRAMLAAYQPIAEK